MALTLSPLLPTEIPSYVRLELEAFRSHPRIPMLWPRGYTDDLYTYYENNKQESFADPQCRFLKVVDTETGKMIAVSEWTFALDVAKQAEKEVVDPKGGPPDDWPVEGNWEMRRFFALNLERWKREYLDGTPYIELNVLVTHPDAHRRGAGTKLLSWGMAEADRLGVRIALEGTPAGIPLYKRCGFQEMEVIMADMKDFGWDQPYEPETAKRVWMIREPVPQQ